jgi:peptidoglycan/LPS O-acetylase OafA/YrhL
MYITIAFIVALSIGGVIRQINLSGLGYDLLFLSNYCPVSGIPIGLWSLAVEEHFYMGFPILLAALSQRLSALRCGLPLAVRGGAAHSYLGSLPSHRLRARDFLDPYAA